MNVQRFLGFLLVALQSAALAYGFRTPLFSAVVFAVSLFGMLSSVRLASPKAARRWPIVLAVLYIVQSRVVPPGWYSGARSYLFTEACLIAEYFVVFQVGQFFVRRDGDRLPGYLPILAIVAMTFAADVGVNPQGRVIFQLMSIALIALSAGFFAASRLPAQRQTTGRRGALQGITLLIIAAIGWGAASSLHRYARQIDMAMGVVMNPPRRTESAGFSGQGRLGSVARQKGTTGSRVALRVVADDQPGYMRGRAFDAYADGRWSCDAGQVTLTPDGEERLGEMADSPRGDRTFILHRSDASDWSHMEIWPNLAFREVVFTPPGTTALQAPVDRLSINLHGIIETDEMPPRVPYMAWTSQSATEGAVPMDGERLAGAVSLEELQHVAASDWQRLTALPDDLDPRVRELAVRVTDRTVADGEKIAAVEQYFLDNYEYQFGIDIPGHADPLTYFLLEKPAAHCEYFASGAAVLLRAVDVPCRYVTGFVVCESNDYGGYWVARNRDAHAWVEAYDSQQGWVLVEATPASGVPDAIPVSAASQIWDSLRAGWQRLVATIRQGGIRAVAQMCARLVMRPTSLVVLALIVVGFACRRLWRRRWQRSAVPRDPLVQQLHGLLRRMDRRCRQFGLTREAHETLHQFAARIESASPDPSYRQAADWYRELAAIRYGGRVTTDTVQSLQQSYRVTAATKC